MESYFTTVWVLGLYWYFTSDFIRNQVNSNHMSHFTQTQQQFSPLLARLLKLSFILKDAYPRGEIFLGHKDDNYSIKEGAPRGCKDQDFSFSLTTPERTYVMSAPTSDERARWIQAINTVLERVLRPQDNQSKMAISENRKSARNSRHSWLSFL